jgi:hypothetical protein
MNPSEPWTWIDWSWVAAGVMVGLTGMLLAWRSVRRGRTGKCPACPGCGYDMRGMGGLRCPECGRVALSAADLLRRPRRWPVALAGLAIALAGAGAGVHPQVKRNGWVSLLPTTAIMFYLPADDAGTRYDEETREWIENPAVREFRRRLSRGSVSDWQVRWAVEHRHRMLLHRDKWPVDRALVLGVRRPCWSDLGETKLLARIPDAQPIGAGVRHSWGCGNAAMCQQSLERGQLAGTLPPGTRSVTLDYRFSYAVYDPDATYPLVSCFRTLGGTVTIPIEAVATHDDACAPCPAETFGAALRAAASLRLGEKIDPADPDEPESWQEFCLDTDALQGVLSDTTAHLQLEPLRDGVPAGEPNYILTLGDARRGWLDDCSCAAQLEPLRKDWSQETPAEIARWSVRLTGRRTEAYAMPRVERGKSKECQWPLTQTVRNGMFGDVLLRYDKPRYWKGSVVVPLTDLLERGRADLKARIAKAKTDE